VTALTALDRPGLDYGPFTPSRPVLADPHLPHQIVLRFRPGRSGSMEVAVACNCTGLATLASRQRWEDPGEPMRIWRAHMAEVAARG
jgi:hypothetical protein